MDNVTKSMMYGSLTMAALAGGARLLSTFHDPPSGPLFMNNNGAMTPNYGQVDTTGTTIADGLNRGNVDAGGTLPDGGSCYTLWTSPPMTAWVTPALWQSTASPLSYEAGTGSFCPGSHATYTGNVIAYLPNDFTSAGEINLTLTWPGLETLLSGWQGVNGQGFTVASGVGGQGAEVADAGVSLFYDPGSYTLNLQLCASQPMLGSWFVSTNGVTEPIDLDASSAYPRIIACSPDAGLLPGQTVTCAMSCGAAIGESAVTFGGATLVSAYNPTPGYITGVIADGGYDAAGGVPLAVTSPMCTALTGGPCTIQLGAGAVAPTLFALAYQDGGATQCVDGPGGGITCTMRGVNLGAVTSYSLSACDGYGCAGAPSACTGGGPATGTGGTGVGTVTFSIDAGTAMTACAVTVSNAAAPSNTIADEVIYLPAALDGGSASAYIAGEQWDASVTLRQWGDLIQARTLSSIGTPTLLNQNFGAMNGQPTIGFPGDAATYMAPAVGPSITQGIQFFAIVQNLGTQGDLGIELDTTNNVGLGMVPFGHICSCAGGVFAPCIANTLATSSAVSGTAAGANSTIYLNNSNAGATGTGSGVFTSTAFLVGRGATDPGLWPGNISFEWWGAGYDVGRDGGVPGGGSPEMNFLAKFIAKGIYNISQSGYP